MKKQLATGVNFHYLPSSQFKTIQVAVQMKMPLERKKITSYSLLSQLLVTNTRKYPTQTQFRKRLAELYGARITSQSSRKGNLNILSLHLSLVNDRLIGSHRLYEEAIDFLYEVLFHPHIIDGKFHEETVKREKENLRESLLALTDDKMAYAQQKLSALHYDDPAQKISTQGALEDLNEISSKSLTHIYQQLLQESEIDILVVGELEEKRALHPFSLFEFTPRKASKAPIVYQQALHKELRYAEEIQDIFQAKLNIAFSAPVIPRSKDFYSLQVFNGIFGGFPHSKLFMEVREKNSLAYYASSNFDVFRQTLYVQTGIETENAEKVQSLIMEQLKQIQSGNFTPLQLTQTKVMLVQLIKQLSDYPETILARNYEEILTGEDLSLTHWISQIEDVTFSDVQDISKRMVPQAVFLLKGEK